MKRLTMLVAIAAVGFGTSAFSQTQDSPRAPAKAAPAAKSDASAGPVQRATAATKRVARRSADAVRRTGQAVERKLPPAPANQRAGVVAERDASPNAAVTGAGTAAGTDTMAGARGDSSRQARMDDAYGHWKQGSGSSGERR